jgi:hypothetical protein
MTDNQIRTAPLPDLGVNYAKRANWPGTQVTRP